MTPLHSRWIALGMLAAAVAVPTPGVAGDEARPATHEGFQVEYDPKTGTYSVPSPGTLAPAAPASARSAERTDTIVITPVQSPAGGYKIIVPNREQQ